MEGLIMAAQLLLGLSILVGVHELGHMLAAKYFGMRVEKFSIGFPPKVLGFTKGETEYSLGAIPLGGFVKITGMIDESLDTAALSAEPEPYEFRAKPAWQRLIVMLGGIVVNVITGIIIFIAITFIYGETYHSRDEVNKRGIVAYPIAKKIGLQTGDKIIKVNGKDFNNYNEIFSSDVLFGDNSYYTVDRSGRLIDIQIPSSLIGDLSKKRNRESFIEPIYPFRVGRVLKGSNASKAGLEKGDIIVEVAGKPTQYFHEFQEVLQKEKGHAVSIKVNRHNKVLTLKAQIDNTGKIGFEREAMLATSVRKFGLGESVVRGASGAFDIVFLNVKGLGKIFSGQVKAQDSISGPIGIATQFGGTWEWLRFWTMVGILSMVLAFMNLLPIPALDGGHVLFLTYEIVSGRKPSDKFLEISQKVGMVILLALMVFAFGNDIWKLFQ